MVTRLASLDRDLSSRLTRSGICSVLGCGWKRINFGSPSLFGAKRVWHTYCGIGSEALKIEGMTQFSRPPSLDHLFRAEYRLWKLEVSKQRAYNVRKAWQKHVAEHEIGRLPVNAVTVAQAREFLLTLPVGHDVRVLLLQWLRRLGRQAVRQGWLAYDTFEDVKVRRPPKGSRRPKYFDPRTEVPLLLEHASKSQHDVFVCAYFGAMRRQDIKRLRGEHIDFEANTIDFIERAH